MRTPSGSRRFAGAQRAIHGGEVRENATTLLANADYDSWCGIRENRDFLRWLFFLCMTIFILIALHFIGCLAAECVIQRNLGKGWPSFKRVWEGANRWRTNNPHYYYVKELWR